MQQRRKTRRYDARLEGFYEVFTPASQKRPTATTNVAAEGVTLLTGTHTELGGARLRIHLALPSGERVQLLGAIVWVRPPVQSSADALILPGTVGVRLAPGEQPAAYRAFLDECAARLPEEPPLPDDARAFIAEARSEQAARRAAEPPRFPRALTAAERLRRGLAPLAPVRKSQPPGEGRASQPPGEGRPSQPPLRPSQPPPAPPGEAPRRTRPPLGIDSSLGLLPDPPRRPTRGEDQITDEDLTRVLREFLVTRSSRLPRQATPKPAPPPAASLDAMLREFVAEVQVPDRPTLPDDDLDAILDAVLSETTWWRRGLRRPR